MLGHPIHQLQAVRGLAFGFEPLADPLAVGVVGDRLRAVPHRSVDAVMADVADQAADELADARVLHFLVRLGWRGKKQRRGISKFGRGKKQNGAEKN